MRNSTARFDPAGDFTWDGERFVPTAQLEAERAATGVPETTKRQFITMTNAWSWGRGDTPDEALKVAKRHASGKPTSWVTVELPEGSEDGYVDQLGRVCWTWTEGADQTGRPTEVASHTKQ